MYIFDTRAEANAWVISNKRGKKWPRVCCLFRGSVWDAGCGDTAVWKLQVEQLNGDAGCSIMSVGGRSRDSILASLFQNTVGMGGML